MSRLTLPSVAGPPERGQGDGGEPRQGRGVEHPAGPRAVGRRLGCLLEVRPGHRGAPEQAGAVLAVCLHRLAEREVPPGLGLLGSAASRIESVRLAEGGGGLVPLVLLLQGAGVGQVQLCHLRALAAIGVDGQQLIHPGRRAGEVPRGGQRLGLAPLLGLALGADPVEVSEHATRQRLHVDVLVVGELLAQELGRGLAQLLFCELTVGQPHRGGLLGQLAARHDHLALGRRRRRLAGHVGQPGGARRGAHARRVLVDVREHGVHRLAVTGGAKGVEDGDEQGLVGGGRGQGLAGLLAIEALELVGGVAAAVSFALRFQRQHRDRARLHLAQISPTLVAIDHGRGVEGGVKERRRGARISGCRQRAQHGDVDDHLGQRRGDPVGPVGTLRGDRGAVACVPAPIVAVVVIGLAPLVARRLDLREVQRQQGRQPVDLVVGAQLAALLPLGLTELAAGVRHGRVDRHQHRAPQRHAGRARARQLGVEQGHDARRQLGELPRGGPARLGGAGRGQRGEELPCRRDIRGAWGLLLQAGGTIAFRRVWPRVWPRFWPRFWPRVWLYLRFWLRPGPTPWACRPRAPPPARLRWPRRERCLAREIQGLPCRSW
ncbi:MAG: hypothetical protein IPI49_18515 [Myxococcales bacterium]|nr:hypothetical protein [Myxococcales bacterium]